MSVPLPPELEEAKRLLYRALSIAQDIDADAAALHAAEEARAREQAKTRVGALVNNLVMTTFSDPYPGRLDDVRTHVHDLEKAWKELGELL